MNVNFWFKRKHIQNIYKYLFEISTVQAHMTIKGWYIFEFSVTQIALHWLYITCAVNIRNRGTCRSACRPAAPGATPAFLTPLLCL